MFDLLTEPWLPVLDAGTDLRATPDAPAALREVGLREALLRAHEIREVAASTPLETIALDRLLLALAIDVYQGAQDLDEWLAIWHAGRLPAEPLDDYLAEWGERFDLFHPDRPFYQRADTDASQEGKDPAPLAKLFHARASGNNATLFAHDLDSEPDSLSLAEAARGVVAAQAAALGGGVSKPFNFSHAPLVGRAQFWIRGRSLLDALLLNSPPDATARMGATAKDAPVWRRDLPTTYARRRHQGLLDVLTWPARRVTLDTETVNGEPRATGLYLTQGDKLDPQPIDDPLAAHVPSKDEGVFPMGFRAGRALWRDATTLFQVSGPGAPGAPRTFRWAVELVELEAPGEAAALRRVFREHGVDAFGMKTKKGKAGVVELWRHERLPLHVPILQEDARRVEMGRALEAAEAQVDRNGPLRLAIRTTAEYALAPPPPGADAYPNADPKAVSALATSLGAEPRYWAALEPLFFDFLRALAEADTSEGYAHAQAVWRGEVAMAAQRAFDAATSAFGGDARHLRAVAQGRARLAAVAPESSSPPDDLSSSPAAPPLSPADPVGQHSLL